MWSQEAKDRLRASLMKVHEWPSVYMYKFVLEPGEERLGRLLALFPAESEVLRRYSKTGKYVSITVKEVMVSPDAVVERYEAVELIDGVIVL